MIVFFENSFLNAAIPAIFNIWIIQIGYSQVKIPSDWMCMSD